MQHRYTTTTSAPGTLRCSSNIKRKLAASAVLLINVVVCLKFHRNWNRFYTADHRRRWWNGMSKLNGMSWIAGKRLFTFQRTNLSSEIDLNRNDFLLINHYRRTMYGYEAHIGMIGTVYGYDVRCSSNIILWFVRRRIISSINFFFSPFPVGFQPMREKEL